MRKPITHYGSGDHGHDSNIELRIQKNLASLRKNESTHTMFKTSDMKFIFDRAESGFSSLQAVLEDQKTKENEFCSKLCSNLRLLPRVPV